MPDQRRPSDVSPGRAAGLAGRVDLRLQLHWGTDDATGDFLHELANRKLREYKAIIQSGSKAGQSYFDHVLDLVLLLERLQEPLQLPDVERRCLYCACVVHDLNKVAPYNRRAGARHTYADQASEPNIAAELARLEAERFFHAWRDYLADIVALAHAHQGNLAITATGLDRTTHHRFKLGWDRLQRLGWLMYAIDTLVTSRTLEEARSKGQALDKLNIFMGGVPRHWVTHRVAEHRGLLTNVIHNCVVAYLLDAAGAVDLLYYPDGVAYLVPSAMSLPSEGEVVEAVAARVHDRLAELQQRDVAKFIKNAPWGIAVDAAALESGATPAAIFEVVLARVQAKSYDGDWVAKRTIDVEADLRAALGRGKLDQAARAYVEERLASGVLPPGTERLRAGELLMAYRNYLNAHLVATLCVR